jgi:hypothetical protein
MMHDFLRTLRRPAHHNHDSPEPLSESGTGEGVTVPGSHPISIRDAVWLPTNLGGYFKAKPLTISIKKHARKEMPF